MRSTKRKRIPPLEDDIPDNKAVFYRRKIKKKIFPSETNQTDGQFVFEDESRLEFKKENRYFPIPTGNDDSFAKRLVSEITKFEIDIGNTNEVGFEIHLVDGSLLRQVPMGMPAELNTTADGIAKELRRQTKKDREKYIEWVKEISPLVAELIQAKTINKKRRPKKKKKDSRAE
jgi:hypothetical protein